MNLARSRAALVSIALFALAIAGGCYGGTQGDATATPGPGGGPGSTPTAFGIRGQAKVDSIEVNLLGSSPVRVQVVARGYLQDGCTKIADLSQKRDGNTFTVTIGTYRAPNVMCTQITMPYLQNVDLDVAGLKAGTYTVNVNGVSKQFDLKTDNALQ
jgi:inhibitor of cysteine peptidase